MEHGDILIFDFCDGFVFIGSNPAVFDVTGSRIYIRKKMPEDILHWDAFDRATGQQVDDLREYNAMTGGVVRTAARVDGRFMVQDREVAMIYEVRRLRFVDRNGQAVIL